MTSLHLSTSLRMLRVLDIEDVTIEDCKGVKTPLYKLKKSLMKSIYDIDILEL